MLPTACLARPRKNLPLRAVQIQVSYFSLEFLSIIADVAVGTEAVESGLLKKHSKVQTYSTSRYEYPNLRVFFREHPQFTKLPTDPVPLPLLVFLHGLGGSVAQFDPLLASLVNVASSLAIDLPGCGLSAFDQKAWGAYTMESLAELISIVISKHRVTGQGVVLIGHSLGCSLAAMVASKDLVPNSVAEYVIGLIAICPRAEPPTENEVATFTKLLWIPSPVFDLWRRWDRRGGKDSISVRRFVGPGADEKTKLLQYRFNNQSKTPVWRRMAFGTLPRYENGVAKGGLPGKDGWANLRIPMFLIAGEDDHVTKPENITKIASFLGKGSSIEEIAANSKPTADSATTVIDHKSSSGQDRTISSIQAEDFLANKEATAEDSSGDPLNTRNTFTLPPQQYSGKQLLKTTVLPKPASHAMLYQPTSVRVLAGLIFDFLSKQISPRMDLGWQLQYLSSSGKWDVKNVEKWKAVPPVSEPINDIFRAMKTLREVDPTHSPVTFSQDWGDQIKDIVDISHEAPVYDPKNLSKNGVTYHKFPTVSKIPPTEAEVTEFIRAIDDIRGSQSSRKAAENWGDQFYIGVHCHYGFNRTGFFVVCYLIERCGYSVDDAIEEFRVKRPNGIRHEHFLDELYVRYCKGLRRAPTL
jgi:pimeloyl-ACP methyl ester carboxylesterase/protein-tyrosine phosphatase